jgi:predicted Fe-S protein YdhL (DUF1289 family)
MIAIQKIAEQARRAIALDENLPSPCISLCTMNAASQLCDGCFRTLDEIAAWSRMDDEDKRTVWARIEQRVGAETS